MIRVFGKEKTDLKYQLNSMLLNVSKEFNDIEQKQVFKTIGNDSVLQKEELHNTEKMLEDKALGNTCDICMKVFKTETSHINHDKKFH